MGKRATREYPAQPTTYPARFARAGAAGRRAWEREVCVWTGLSIRLLSLRSSFYSVKPGVAVLIALLEADVAPALQLLL